MQYWKMCDAVLITCICYHLLKKKQQMFQLLQCFHLWEQKSSTPSNFYPLKKLLLHPLLFQTTLLLFIKILPPTLLIVTMILYLIRFLRNYRIHRLTNALYLHLQLHNPHQTLQFNHQRSVLLRNKIKHYLWSIQQTTQKLHRPQLPFS